MQKMKSELFHCMLVLAYELWNYQIHEISMEASKLAFLETEESNGSLLIADNKSLLYSLLYSEPVRI